MNRNLIEMKNLYRSQPLIWTWYYSSKGVLVDLWASGHSMTAASACESVFVIMSNCGPGDTDTVVVVFIRADPTAPKLPLLPWKLEIDIQISIQSLSFSEEVESRL